MRAAQNVHVAGNAGQPRVGVCVWEQAAVENRHHDAIAVALLGRQARVGRRVGPDLLRLCRGTEVEDMIRRRYPPAERPVDGVADLLHAPAFVSGELQTSQAAQVVVVRHRGAGHDSGHAINVGVTNKKGPFPVEVVNVVRLGPIGRVSRRACQTVQDTWNTEQDQADRRVETASRLAPPRVGNPHRRPKVTRDSCRQRSNIFCETGTSGYTGAALYPSSTERVTRCGRRDH